MRLDRVHHIAIIVSDYEKSKEFYVDKLGFEIVKETHRKDRGDIKLDVRQGDVELEIFVVQNPPRRVTNPEACGLRHLAFFVENIETAVDRLNEMGIQTEPIRIDEITNKRMTFFKDPDGLPLELHE